MDLRRTLILAAWVGLGPALTAQVSKENILARMAEGKGPYEEIALKIWSFAELGYKETRSSVLLQQQLRAEGFEVTAGIAGMPTAFVATYGSGRPVIAVLGEFDALPGMSQEAVAEREPRAGATAGHACGHNLFGAASAEAVVAVKNWLKAGGRSGTIRFVGSPAEEGGAGKVYLVRAGVFSDVDVALHWHPGDRNYVPMEGSLANKMAKFRFHGVAAHAAASPERGRSALDGVEAMNNMVNMMREHVPDTTRMHYVITRGGDAPNIVPAFAEVYYYVRSPSRIIDAAVFERVENAARGAALGTGTTVDWEIIAGLYELLPNEVLGRAMQANLEVVGGVTYTPDETAFAEKIGRTLAEQARPAETAARVQPFDAHPQVTLSGSTDVGDVSWAVPTIGLITATWAPGTPAHSWQAVACGGTSLGLKGMQVAAKTLALTAIDLISQPELVQQARTEFEKRRGPDFTYAPLLGDRAPPLDYRD